MTSRPRPSVRRRGPRLVALVALTSCALAACGPHQAEQVTPSRYVDPPTVDDAAREAVGEQAEQAYDETAELLLDTWLTVPLIDPGHEATEAELTEAVAQGMSADAAQSWADLVAADLADDQEARHAVQLLRFHGWEDEESTLAPDPVTYQSITEGAVGLGEPTEEGATSLRVSLVHRAGVRLMRANSPYDVTLVKPLELSLVPSPDDPDHWLIDTFEGTLRTEVDGQPVEPSPDEAAPTSS